MAWSPMLPWPDTLCSVGSSLPSAPQRYPHSPSTLMARHRVCREGNQGDKDRLGHWAESGRQWPSQRVQAGGSQRDGPWVMSAVLTRPIPGLWKVCLRCFLKNFQGGGLPT